MTAGTGDTRIMLQLVGVKCTLLIVGGKEMFNWEDYNQA